MAIKEFTIMLLVCFIQTANSNVFNLSMADRLRTLAEKCRLWPNQGTLGPLLIKMRADILKRGVLRILSDCAVEAVAVFLAFALAGETDWTASN